MVGQGLLFFIAMRGVLTRLERYLTNKYWVIFIALFCAVLWGSAFPVLKVSYVELHIAPNDEFALILFAGIRFFLASLIILGIISFILRQRVKVKINTIPQLFFLGVLQISLQYFFFYNGLAHTSGMKGAILSSAGTFFVVLLAHFVYTNDRLNWRKGFGLMVGLGGIILVNWGQHFTLDFSWQGEGFMILSGLASALGTIYAKHLAKEIHPFIMTFWQMLLGSLLLITFGLSGLKSHMLIFTPKASALLIYSAFLSATAFSLWFALLKYNKAGEISVYNFMTPVAGSILSALFIPGERLSPNLFIALGLVALGIIVVNYHPGTGKRFKEG